MIYEKRLESGTRMIGEYLPHFRSISFGVWFGTGSVKETGGEDGLSHFLEHMLFKGTAKRSASDIASEMDGLGAQLNAFTSKECTCYYVKAMDEHIDRAVDVLSDLVYNSTFSPEEIEKEKGVVVEEILMIEDTPEDLAHELLSQTYYAPHPLSRPILGTQDSVRAFTRDDLLGYTKKHYTARNMVIAAAGNISEARLTELTERFFANAPSGQAEYQPEPFDALGKRFEAREKDIEQAHICLGFPAFPRDHDLLYPLFVLNNALGGTMSSRLFQKIREEKGLAYSVYTFPVSYSNCGMFGVYAGSGSAQAPEVIKLTLEEIESVKKTGLTDEEFARSKEQLKGSYILGQESTSGRMNSIGKSKLLLDRVDSEETVLEKINRVTPDDVRSIMPTVLDISRMTVALVGRINALKSEIDFIIG